MRLEGSTSIFICENPLCKRRFRHEKPGTPPKYCGQICKSEVGTARHSAKRIATKLKYSKSITDPLGLK